MFLINNSLWTRLSYVFPRRTLARTNTLKRSLIKPLTQQTLDPNKLYPPYNKGKNHNSGS